VRLAVWFGGRTAPLPTAADQTPLAVVCFVSHRVKLGNGVLRQQAQKVEAKQLVHGLRVRKLVAEEEER
jgi:hypothetical protein